MASKGLIINLTILECKLRNAGAFVESDQIINLTILECKSQVISDNGQKFNNNKSNHIGM